MAEGKAWVSAERRFVISSAQMGCRYGFRLTDRLNPEDPRFFMTAREAKHRARIIIHQEASQRGPGTSDSLDTAVRTG
jgi:hypothetical protein